MERRQLLADRIREVLLNGYWIANTNFKEKLSGMSWQQAIQKAGSLNNIAALTYHINYYLVGILPVFTGGALEIKDKFSFDLPAITCQQDWDNLVNALLQNAELLAKAVEEMPGNMLDKPFAGEQYGTWQRNLEGVIEHCYYHLGQVTLIKKLITGN